jgi:hypothetical protein
VLQKAIWAQGAFSLAENPRYKELHNDRELDRATLTQVPEISTH